jgi:hypothetical protein
MVLESQQVRSDSRHGWARPKSRESRHRSPAHGHAGLSELLADSGSVGWIAARIHVGPLPGAPRLSSLQGSCAQGNPWPHSKSASLLAIRLEST